MWLHPYGNVGWRELWWSMSWQRPGGKKCTYPRIIMHILGFYIGDIQNTRVRLNLPKVILIAIAIISKKRRRENYNGKHSSNK